jgi:hypothetical protein
MFVPFRSFYTVHFHLNMRISHIRIYLRYTHCSDNRVHMNGHASI